MNNLRDESVHDLRLRGHVARPYKLRVAGEPLVEPEIVPPLESDEVAEPHVGQLVGDHRGHPLLVGGGGGLGVVQEIGFSVN